MVFFYHALRTMTDDSSDIFQSFPSWLLEAKLVLLTQPLWRIYSVGISWAMLHLFFFSPKNHPISSFGINSMLVKQYYNASNSTHLWWFPYQQQSLSLLGDVALSRASSLSSQPRARRSNSSAASSNSGRSPSLSGAAAMISRGTSSA